MTSGVNCSTNVTPWRTSLFVCCTSLGHRVRFLSLLPCWEGVGEKFASHPGREEAGEGNGKRTKDGRLGEKKRIASGEGLKFLVSSIYINALNRVHYSHRRCLLATYHHSRRQEGNFSKHSQANGRPNVRRKKRISTFSSERVLTMSHWNKFLYTRSHQFFHRIWSLLLPNFPLRYHSLPLPGNILYTSLPLTFFIWTRATQILLLTYYTI